MIDIFYGTIFLISYILIKINNRYRYLDYNIRKFYNITNEKFYTIDMSFNINSRNCVMFLLSLYYNQFIYIVFLFKILCLMYFMKQNKNKYICQTFNPLIYILIFNMSSLTINKIVSIFAMCFSDFHVNFYNENY